MLLENRRYYSGAVQSGFWQYSLWRRLEKIWAGIWEKDDKLNALIFARYVRAKPLTPMQQKAAFAPSACESVSEEPWRSSVYEESKREITWASAMAQTLTARSSLQEKSFSFCKTSHWQLVCVGRLIAWAVLGQLLLYRCSGVFLAFRQSQLLR